jgi:hypothetical protein
MIGPWKNKNEFQHVVLKHEKLTHKSNLNSNMTYKTKPY